MDLQEKFEQGCAGLILVEPGHSHAIGELGSASRRLTIRVTRWVFPQPRGPNEKQMVLVLGKRTLRTRSTASCKSW